MTLSIRFTAAPDGDDGPFSLAPASVWTALAQWAAQFKAAGKLRELCDRGAATDTAALARQLQQALARRPPKSEPVAGAARELAKLLGVGDRKETATVTDE